MFHDSMAIAQEKMTKVCMFLERYTLPPTPLNFQVVYTYISQTNIDLNNAIDRAIAANNLIDHILVEQLYSEFINTGHTTQVSMIQNVDGVINSLSHNAQTTEKQIIRFVDQVNDCVHTLDENNIEQSRQALAILNEQTVELLNQHKQFKKELGKHQNLDELRNIFIPKKKILLIDDEITEAQKTFIYAKELAYNFLKIKERLYTFPWIKFESFDQVLNNFIASYFAGALVIPKKVITEKLTDLFDQEEWKPLKLHRIINHFNCSQETFYQRLTNILPKFFNIRNLFFLRFSHIEDTAEFRLSKELHITQQQAPHATRNNEHYCRKWVAIKTIKEYKKSTKERATFGVQISSYENHDSEYLVLSSATADPFKKHINRSVTIGMLLSNHLKKKLQFLNEHTFKKEVVGVTCETCAVKNCAERIAKPSRLEKKNKYKILPQNKNFIFLKVTYTKLERQIKQKKISILHYGYKSNI